MTSAIGPQRNDLLTVSLAAAPSIGRVQLTRIELAPGQASGAHHHPCDVVGIVISGSIRFEIDGLDEVILHTGDPFFEPRNAHVIHFDNANEEQPTVFLACYLLGPDQTHVITNETATPAPD